MTDDETADVDALARRTEAAIENSRRVLDEVDAGDEYNGSVVNRLAKQWL